MAVISSLNRVSDGDQLNEGYFNSIRSEPLQIYTGTDYDQSGAGTNNHTLTIAAGEIENYVLIVATYNATGGATTDTHSATVDLKIETSENGAASWTTRFDDEVGASSASRAGEFNTSASVTFYYAPTSDEKTNGLDVRFTSTVGLSGGTATGTFINKQTLIIVN